MKHLTPRQLIEKLQNLPEDAMDVPLGTMPDEGDGPVRLCPVVGVSSLKEWVEEQAEDLGEDPETLYGPADKNMHFLCIETYAGPELEAFEDLFCR